MLTFMHFHFIYHVFSYTYACYFLEGDQVNHGPWSIFFRKKHHLLQFTSASISLLTDNYLCTLGDNKVAFWRKNLLLDVE
jgi:hypothetical protein